MLGYYACMILAVCFWLIALFFALGKEKAANCLSGFSFLPEEERAKYDRKQMAKDSRNQFLLWGCIMLAGAAASRLISGYCVLGVCAIWLILFFRNVHLDLDKAYGKYRL